MKRNIITDNRTEEDFTKEDYKYIASFRKKNQELETKALVRFFSKKKVEMIKMDNYDDKILIFF